MIQDETKSATEAAQPAIGVRNQYFVPRIR